MQPTVSIITGAASGIGRQFGSSIAELGHVVILCDIDTELLRKEFVDLARYRGQIILRQLDVSDASQWQSLIDETIVEHGSLDYLFNIAGVIQPGYVHEIGLNEVDRHIDVNVKGVIYGTQLAARQMVKQRRGHIINMSSLAGIAPVAGLTLYAASKFAVRGYSLSAATELRDKNVFVTVICPDAVQTPMLDYQLDYPEAALTFSGSRILTTDQVVQSLHKAMKRRPLELLLPRSRGLLAKAASAFPALNKLMGKRLISRGLVKSQKLRAQISNESEKITGPPDTGTSKQKKAPQIRALPVQEWTGVARTGTTCLVGAGVSGITIGKFLKEHGIPFDCLEKSSVLGGNWAFQNPNRVSSAYRSLHIDTSKEMLQFEDFPMPEHYPTFAHHSHINEYLNRVVDRFSLRPHIQLGTAVKLADRRDDGRWDIKLDNGETRQYDNLVVGTGHHWDPRYPDFPGEFTGQILHSHHYIDAFEPVEMRGKRILVVGIGNSAADIASELSHPAIAQRLYLSTRRGAHVIPKYLFGRPLDQVVQTKPWLPLGMQRRLAGMILRLATGKVESYGLPKPDHRLLEAHPTVSSDLLQRIGNGDVCVKPNVERLDGNTVQFEDGSSEQIDVVIYATGYHITLPFFQPDFLSIKDNEFPLFKRTFIPGIENLMFIGFAQAVPSLIRFIQIQSRWVASYLAGEYSLPPIAEMERTIQSDARRQGQHYVTSPRHTMQVDNEVYAWYLNKEWSAGRRRMKSFRSKAVRH